MLSPWLKRTILDEKLLQNTLKIRLDFKFPYTHMYIDR